MDVGKGEVVMQKPQGRDNKSEDTARRFTFDAVYDWTYVPLDIAPCALELRNGHTEH